MLPGNHLYNLYSISMEAVITNTAVLVYWMHVTEWQHDNIFLYTIE